ncbi:MAG: hypothetical protein LBP52_04730 [Burkholderiaceae bacterium]|jgi:hypothetical protein|nr:hypothetical protein [Burkholderiaceae bacterium]
MVTKKSALFCWACIFLLFPASLLGLSVIAERFYAALFNAWKFHGYGGDKGIDIGASSFFLAMCFCLCGLFVCMLVAFRPGKHDRKWVYRSALVTGAIYSVNCLLLLVLIASDLAFITYER